MLLAPSLPKSITSLFSHQLLKLLGRNRNMTRPLEWIFVSRSWDLATLRGKQVELPASLSMGCWQGTAPACMSSHKQITHYTALRPRQRMFFLRWQMYRLQKVTNVLFTLKPHALGVGMRVPDPLINSESEAMRMVRETTWLRTATQLSQHFHWSNGNACSSFAGNVPSGCLMPPAKMVLLFHIYVALAFLMTYESHDPWLRKEWPLDLPKSLQNNSTSLPSTAGQI